MWMWLRFARCRIGSNSVRSWMANCADGVTDVMIGVEATRLCYRETTKAELDEPVTVDAPSSEALGAPLMRRQPARRKWTS